MPVDKGLLIASALAQGLRGGLDEFRNVRREQKEEDRADKLYKMGLLKSGFTETPEGLEMTPEERERRDQDRYYKEAILATKLKGAGLTKNPLYKKGGLLPGEAGPLPDKMDEQFIEAPNQSSTDAGKLVDKLYPGEFEGVDFSNIRPSDMSNFFKVQRLREGQKGRERILQLKPQSGLIRGGLLRGPRAGEGENLHDPKAVERYQKMLVKQEDALNPIIRSAETIDKFTQLAKTNPSAAAALPVMLARQVGEKGPLSNFDLKMWGGSRAVIARLQRSAQLLASGTLPDEDLGFIKQITTQLGQAAKDRLAEAEENMTGKYTSNYGGEPGENYRLITGRNKEISDPVVDRLFSKSRNKTKLIYKSGREEIVDGDQRQK